MSKKVVIIGGGLGGIEAAKKLDKFADVTVIEKNAHAYNPVASPRSLTDASIIPKLFLPLDKVVSKGKILHEEVTEVTQDEVRLKGDKPAVKFDYLIIATGSSYAFPYRVNFSEEEQQNKLRALNTTISNAKKVLIVGGGPIGVETAGEIGSKYPGTKVTIVHSGSQIISETAPKKFVNKLLENFKSMNVEIILNEKVDLSDDEKKFDREIKVEQKNYTLSGGKTIDADLLLVCIGARPNNSILTNNFGDKIAENGKLKVNKFLQVEGHQNIFAIGDIANTEPGGLAWYAAKHAENVASNLKLIIQGKPEKMKPLEVSVGMFVTQGPQKGAGLLPFGVVGSFMVKNIKGKTMGIPRAWDAYNQKPPK